MRTRRPAARALTVIAAVAALGAGPGANAATAAWSSPQTLSPGLAGGTPTLAFDAAAAALTTWASASRAARFSASRTPSAITFKAQRAAPNIGEEIVEGLPPAPLVDDAGHVVAIAQRKVRPACGLATIYTLTPRFGRMSGSFAPARGTWTVYSHTEPPAVALAGNRRGTALVAWLQLQRDARGRCVNRELVRVAVRRPGGTFGSPVTLARGASSAAIAASVSANGRMLVTWRHGDRLETRSRSATGTWAAVQRLETGRVDSFATTLSSTGAAAVVWTRRTPATPESPRVIEAASRGATSSRFVTKELERGTWPGTLIDRPERRAVRLLAVGSGALAAWTSWAGDHLQVRTATMTGGRFAPARTATPTGQDLALADLAVSATRRPGLALTGTASDSPSGPFVALGTTGGAFGAPEAVGPGASAVNGAALAFSPRTGRPTLVWTQVKTVMASTRTAAAGR